MIPVADAPAWAKEGEWKSPGGTTFIFEKPSAWALRHASEDLRLEIARIVESGAGMDTHNVMAAVLSADKEFVKRIRADLFQHVQFTNGAVKTPQSLSGVEDTAFANDEPGAIYEVLGRAVARFFYPSVSAMISRLIGAASRNTAA